MEDNKKVDVTKAGQYTVAQWCWLWHENYCKPAVKDTTAEYYRSYIEHHVVPNIGSIKLNKLTTLDLLKFYNQTRQSGRVEKYEGMPDRSLSSRTVRGLHAMLSQCLEQAVRERLIPYNPANSCRLPPKERYAPHILPPEKIRAHLAAAEKHGVLAMFYLELTTDLHKTLCKKTGITENIRFHDLRHTYATLAIQNGVDAKTVSSILGHSSAGFTLDTYTHTTPAMQQAADKL